MMKKIFLLLVVFSGNAFASEKLNIVPELSNISFAAIKKQYIVEPVIVENVQGQYANGMFNLAVDFNEIDTGVSIRDNRLNELFFQTKLYPTVKINGAVDLTAMKSAITKTTIKANVEFYGTVKEFEFPVVIHKSKTAVTVSSYKPVIVKASDFNIPAQNLINLATTVGGISISDTIPLNVNLTFEVATAAK